MYARKPKIPYVATSPFATHTIYAWFTIAFILAEFLGIKFTYGVESISVLWPPTGIFGATLALLHRKYWFKIILFASAIDFSAGVLSNSFQVDPDFLCYLYIGLITNPLTALAFAITFQWLIPNARPLSEPKLFAFYITIPILLNTAITSFIAVSLLGIVIPSFPVLAAWQQWWYSDVSGLLIFATPVIMIASSWKRISNGHPRLIEASVMFFAFAIVTTILFTHTLDHTFVHHYQFVILLPIYAWVVSRFGAVVMTLTTFVLTIVVLSALVLNASSFEHAGESPASNVLSVQGFLVPITLTIFFIAAILEHRRTQFESLIENERQLRNLSRIESLGTMAGGVAHDFGNLAIAMRAYHAVLRSEIKNPNETVRSAIHGLEEAADGAQSLTSSLMSFARDEEADTRDQPAVADLCASVRDAVSTLLPLLTPEYKLEVSVPSEPIIVPARSLDLQRMISNLVINACDASESGQGVHITVMRHPKGVWLMVSDEGQGMTEKVRERVFDPFFTTKPRGQGTGLGLAVVAGVVREMGAKINITSSPGNGTTITIDMPVTNITRG